jgi:hypothetical protein
MAQLLNFTTSNPVKYNQLLNKITDARALFYCFYKQNDAKLMK